jgi:hypothetical protein
MAYSEAAAAPPPPRAHLLHSSSARDRPTFVRPTSQSADVGGVSARRFRQWGHDPRCKSHLRPVKAVSFDQPHVPPVAGARRSSAIAPHVTHATSQKRPYRGVRSRKIIHDLRCAGYWGVLAHPTRRTRRRRMPCVVMVHCNIISSLVSMGGALGTHPPQEHANTWYSEPTRPGATSRLTRPAPGRNDAQPVAGAALHRLEGRVGRPDVRRRSSTP